MKREKPKSIAILGGNTVAGIALSLLLTGAGHATSTLKAPPPAPVEDLLRDVDLLIVAPGLGEERRIESLVALGGIPDSLGIPVLAFTSSVEESVFRVESAGVPWPVEVGGLTRAVEAALAGKLELGPTIVANRVGGEAALR